MLRQLVLSSARGRCFAAPYLSDSHRVVLEAVAAVAHIDSAGLEQRAVAHAQPKDKAAIRRVLHHLRGNRAQRRITQEDIDDPRSDLDPLRRLRDRVATHQRVVGRFRNENAAEAGVFDLARKLNEVLVRNSRRWGDRNAETCHFGFLSPGFADKIRLRSYPGRAYPSATRPSPVNAFSPFRVFTFPRGSVVAAPLKVSIVARRGPREASLDCLAALGRARFP